VVLELRFKEMVMMHTSWGLSQMGRAPLHVAAQSCPHRHHQEGATQLSGVLSSSGS
jgi:hypothetical protein